jgi:plasmid stabilization system protein ParE
VKFINHPEADQEIDDAAEYYDNARPGYGLRFTDHLRRAFAQIADAPDRWPIREFGFRKYTLQDFSHTIRYIERKDYIYVVAVPHGSQEPGYWKDRILDEQR